MLSELHESVADMFPTWASANYGAVAHIVGERFGVNYPGLEWPDVMSVTHNLRVLVCEVVLDRASFNRELAKPHKRRVGALRWWADCSGKIDPDEAKNEGYGLLGVREGQLVELAEPLEASRAERDVYREHQILAAALVAGANRATRVGGHKVSVTSDVEALVSECSENWEPVGRIRNLACVKMSAGKAVRELEKDGRVECRTLGGKTDVRLKH